MLSNRRITRDKSWGRVSPALLPSQHLLWESPTQTARLLPFGVSDPVLVKSSDSVNGFSLQGSTHPSWTALRTELLPIPPKPHVSKLAIMGLITSELLLRPSSWRKAHADRSTDRAQEHRGAEQCCAPRLEHSPETSAAQFEVEIS